MTHKYIPPAPDEIKAARLAAGMTQPQAARAGMVSLSAWQKYEAPPEKVNHCKISAAVWALFLQHVEKMKKSENK